MATATASAASWSTARTGRATSLADVDRALEQLASAKGQLRQIPLARRIDLARQCLEGVVGVAREWVSAACEAKGLVPGTSAGSEDVGNGVLATVRYLRLIIQSLADIERQGVPQLPGRIETHPSGRLAVQVVPTRGLFDGIAFSGFRADVWQMPGVNRDNLAQNMAKYYREGQQDEGLALVLGAGNVSSIPPTDAFAKIFQEGKVVLLKMNPVNEYLGPIFERAFQPLVRENLLRIIYGGADVGSYATNHELVDEVHITGSVHSHDAIVWGPPGPERDERRAANNPLLHKPITSELGNVTPWVVVPGPYTDKQLRFHAENLVSTITNNCSFNCAATKAIVTWKRWPQRDTFLNYVREILTKVPPRRAYYPGAEDRYRRWTGETPVDCGPGCLPWTLKLNVHPEEHPQYFGEESFVCVCVETGLDANDETDFLPRAAQFCNDRLFGTLGASVLAHPQFRRGRGNEEAFQKLIAELRYGTIGINYWCALSYAMIAPPWGGYPGGTIQNPTSGIGWVHNTYLFDQPEKTVLEGPFTVFPKPLWFPSVKNADAVTWKVVDLYHRPSVFRVPGLLLSALSG
ncbi:MAG: hypothetical protein K1X74_21845 [Pirellulales bacterium]|nr:hypothetical protein [Pirellulales bacterium]